MGALAAAPQGGSTKHAGKNSKRPLPQPVAAAAPSVAEAAPGSPASSSSYSSDESVAEAAPAAAPQEPEPPSGELQHKKTTVAQSSPSSAEKALASEQVSPAQ